MTSEVVIMNRRAVALAADSAVTITSGVDGRREQRYFKGANKVFELSYHQPVGIMIFDVADVHSVPWEVVIKMYRDHLGQNAYPTLEEYAKGLFSFIENHSTLFSDVRRDELFRRESTYAAILLLNQIEEDPRVANETDPGQKDANRSTVLADIRQQLTALPLPAHFHVTAISEAVAKFGPDLGAALPTILQARRTALPANDLAHTAIEALFKRYTDFLSRTGIVVAGYGESDFFPSFVQYDTYGLVLGPMIADRRQSKAVTSDDGSYIQAFARDDMVFTFMAGVSPDIMEGMLSATRQALTDLADNIIAAGGVQPLPNRDKLIQAEFDKLRDEVIRMQIKNHYNPLTRVVGSLPVDEMASLAETLIMLESLKEKVTAPSETVGGPIDVALITRSEGLVWIRRKHYFDAALNGRFLERQRQRMA